MGSERHDADSEVRSSSWYYLPTEDVYEYQSSSLWQARLWIILKESTRNENENKISCEEFDGRAAGQNVSLFLCNVKWQPSNSCVQ